MAKRVFQRGFKTKTSIRRIAVGWLQSVDHPESTVDHPENAGALRAVDGSI